MQFLRRRTDTLTTRELKQANVGSKDKQVSIFKVREGDKDKDEDEEAVA
jgi:hypothetical protein